MRNAIRTALSTAALVAALALPGASKASGQVYFQGDFPLPHGRISVGVGDFGVGAYVPYPYVDQIEYVPDYGYGFYCDGAWVPVRHYSRGWVVYRRPFSIEREHLYRYRHFDRFDRDGRYDRWHDRYYDRYRDGYRDGYGWRRY